LVEFEKQGLDLTRGIILLTADGELQLRKGRPSVASEYEDIPQDAIPLKPFFYVRDEVIVASWASEDVRRVLTERNREWEPPPPVVPTMLEDVEVLKLSRSDSVDEAADADEAEPVDAWTEVQAILAEVPGRRRRLAGQETEVLEPPASVNVLFYASGMDCGSPAGDPEEPGDRVPERGTPGAGRGVVVALLDSGVLPDYANNPALAADVIFDPARDTDLTYSRGYIHFPGCHGTFVAGVVRRVAPACTIVAIKVLNELGWGSQTQVAAGLYRAVSAGAEVICMSLTAAIPPTGTIDPDTGLPVDPTSVSPLALGPALATVFASHVAMVGAAGNTGRDEPTWPGTLPEVLAVGAVTKKGRQAWFSNFGPWIEVWARGTKVVSAFGTGPYRPIRGGRTLNFSGLAVWSGTSFATPLVAGMIAARKASDGSSPLAAKARVLADCVRRPELGPGPTGDGVPMLTLDTNVAYPPSPPAPTPGP
ncbi:MAG: S8 family serine peptidase, partial [Actinomycetota bacterium]|nr:S8 family serine peptidase [Actinomycetota bacterium]